MSPSLRRLKTRPEFLGVAKARCSWATPGLVLQARRRVTTDAAGAGTESGAGAEPDIGVGLTASRKVGGAVARNRARRRLRAVAAEVLPAAATPGVDYVLIARGGTLSRPYIELAGDLRTALARVCRKGKKQGPRQGRGRKDTGRG
jgi:ribonuclease P protein component